MRSDGDVRGIISPDLSRPLAEAYPAPSQPSDPVKKAVWRRINRDRADKGLPPVAWDAAASRVSDAFCEQQVREKTQGHYLMDGLPPYARMAFGGVFGASSENAVIWITTGIAIEDSLVEYAVSGHDRMMEEKPPKDGHRRTILDPEATHVGVGYFVRNGRFQMSQEFLTRRLESLSLSRASDRLPFIKVEGQVLSPHILQFVTIAREARPVPLTSKQASARTSYSYPEPSEAFVPEGYLGMRVVGALTTDRMRRRGDRKFSFTYRPVEPGLHTFVFWVAQKDGDKPLLAGSATVLFE
jgi:uncharacterized protein YkwD